MIVKSSFIFAFAYDFYRSVLYIHMKSGKYKYIDVPFDAYSYFAISDSLGRGYNAFIKGKFHTEEMTDEEISVWFSKIVEDL